MNLNKILFRRLMNAADDNGGTGAGGAGGTGVDRGDTFTPLTSGDADAAAAAAVAAATAEAAEVEAAAELARGADGKFAKKEKEPDAGPMIPKTRFDEQLSKERTRAEAAERRAAELEAAAAKVVRNLDVEKAVADVAALRKDERKALLDGDEDKAAQLSAQADRLNRQIAIAESGEMTGQAKDQALEDIRFEMTLERLEEKYPALVEGHEDYDQDVVDDILDKQRGLIQRERLSPSKALAKATEAIMKRFESAAAAQTGDKTGLAAAQTGEPRKAAAVAKNLAAAAAQPGSLKDAGLDSDKAGQQKATPNASDMTFEEFEALPEATRAKMRGDLV